MNSEFVILRESITALSRYFIGDQTLENTLQRVVELAHETIDAADMVGVTMLNDVGAPVTAVFTTGEAADIDQAQYRDGSGPCVDAFLTGEVKRIESMSEELRWPEFVVAAREHGIGSTLSLPLVVQGKSYGALNIYSRKSSAFREEDEQIGLLFSQQAAVLLANAKAYWEHLTLSANLTEAMKSRAVIEQAKGMLMVQRDLSADQAFELLRDLSQRNNRKLRDLCAEVVANRGITDSP